MSKDLYFQKISVFPLQTKALHLRNHRYFDIDPFSPSVGKIIEHWWLSTNFHLKCLFIAVLRLVRLHRVVQTQKICFCKDFFFTYETDWLPWLPCHLM